MTNSALTPNLLQAQTLAEATIKKYGDQFSADSLPSDAFMRRRPNSLAESYRHGQAVAKILADWQAEPELQAAGLLHSFVCKEVLSSSQIAQTCTERTAFICQNFWETLQQTPAKKLRGHPLVTKRVKLYTAAYCEPAVAFLAVASLWDHFALARQGDPPLQRHFAAEAQTVLLPLLDMLGIAALKADIEEWLMQRGQNQKDYQFLVQRLIQSEEIRRQAFEQVKARLQPQLPSAQLTYKFPTPTQVYNPHFPEKAHPEAFNRLPVNLFVNTEEECYTALRWIHRFYQPVEQSLVDYIGLSKLNGDRFLLTTVLVPLENTHIRTTFNIRTHQIEQVNQWGLAAILMRERHQVNLPQAWWSNREASYAKISSVPMGALPEKLCVFSPQGELFQFHRGCTVVDYAYQVHSELANQCKTFKINGEAVSPTARLRHLDLVELERDPHFPGPNRTWLTAARTNRARSHIERFLKRQQQGHLRGRTLLDRRLKELAEHYRIDIPDHHVEQALTQATSQHNFERVEQLLAEIAAGRIATDPILHPLFSKEVVRQIELPAQTRLLPHQLQLAQCCKPRLSDDIIGRAKYKNKTLIRLKIHRADCQHIDHLDNNLPLKWRLQPQRNAVARLEITALTDDNLLVDTLQLFQANLPHITLHKVDTIARNGIARLNFTIEARDQQLIDKIAQKLENLSDHQINEVRQMQLLFSEREELVKPAAAASFNPYRRQPVQDREMFFGRSQELAAIYQMLRDGIGVIFVQGQKRVGKTSLLLHLKKHYLSRRSKEPVFVDFQLLGNLSGPNFHYEVASTIYSNLQTDNRASDLEPPLQELFEIEPTTQLIDYLKNVQSCFGLKRLVLLIDEFSRTIDAYQHNTIDDTLFQQWRGVIQATMPQISYVMVVQQQTFNHLLEHPDQQSVAPIWHLLELGEPLLLKPLSEKDARQLIERPTFNHLEYSPEAIKYVWRLTGGRPFLIQAFCFNLVRHVAHSQRRRVEWSDVETVQAEFMQPHESLFAHLLDVVQDIAYAVPICKQLAKTLIIADTPLPFSELQAALPQIPADRLHRSLQALTEQHILAEPEANAWHFTSLLFGRWLAVNTLPVPHGAN